MAYPGYPGYGAPPPGAVRSHPLSFFSVLLARAASCACAWARFYFQALSTSVVLETPIFCFLISSSSMYSSLPLPFLCSRATRLLLVVQATLPLLVVQATLLQLVEQATLLLLVLLAILPQVVSLVTLPLLVTHPQEVCMLVVSKVGKAGFQVHGYISV